MTVAFIILAHRGPDQVARLASRLAPHHVFVHIDQNVPEEVYTEFTRLLGNFTHVQFIKRHQSSWASWGLVEAALEGLQAAINLEDWTHVMLLSGQDYPLLNALEIDNFFLNHIDKSFMPHWHLPSPLWGSDGGRKRVRYWHMAFMRRRIFIPIPRRHPNGILPVGGSMYWCLSRKVANEVLLFTEQRKDVVRFYKHVWIPDELYIPTIVMNGRYADSVINENLTYIRWSNPGSPHPDELNIADVAELVDAGRTGSKVGGMARRKLFARKFNAERQADLLRLLDQQIQ